MAVKGDAAGYRLAYEAGLQAVGEQASTFCETRDRAGALMSAAAVAGGLAAGLAFSADRVGGIDQVGVVGAVFAIIGFVGVVVTTMMIWRPTEGRFVHDGGVILALGDIAMDAKPEAPTAAGTDAARAVGSRPQRLGEARRYGAGRTPAATAARSTRAPRWALRPRTARSTVTIVPCDRHEWS